MPCKVTIANKGKWYCEQCDPQHKRPLPGPNWRRHCKADDTKVSVIADATTKSESIANSILHAIAEGKATRTETEAMELLRYCLSGRCEHYDDIAGCTRTGAGCQRYKHWIGRLTVSGCNLAHINET